MKKFVGLFLFLMAGVAMTLSAAELTAQEKRARSITAAKMIAERNMVETVFGTNLEYFQSVSLMDATTFKNSMTTSSKAHIRGVRFATQYDSSRDIAIVTAELDLAKIADLAPVWKNAKSQTLRRVGFASCTPRSIHMLQALRAAELDAYRHLFALVAGLDIESKTTLRDMMIKDDQIASKLAGSLFAARLIADPENKDRIEWSDNSENASCTVTLELDVNDLEAVLGRKLVGCQADTIRVKGIGLPYRETPAPSNVKEEAKPQPEVRVIERKVIVEREKKILIESEPKVQNVDSTVLRTM